MSISIPLRRILLAPPGVRALFITPKSFISSHAIQRYSTQSVIQPSFWKSLIPKPLRKSQSASKTAKKLRSKEWNPATFFIWIFLFIGSMSIQMIALRQDFTNFSRRADARIGLLKEVIEKIQNGEEVDVEGLLGTGDKEREKEWDEVLQEIERENQEWEDAKRKKPKHGQNLVAKEQPRGPETASSQNTHATQDGRQIPKTNAPPGYY